MANIELDLLEIIIYNYLSVKHVFCSVLIARNQSPTTAHIDWQASKT